MYFLIRRVTFDILELKRASQTDKNNRLKSVGLKKILIIKITFVLVTYTIKLLFILVYKVAIEFCILLRKVTNVYPGYCRSLLPHKQ